jgi:hypothetical protein
MTGVFGELLTVECPQKITEAGEADDELVPKVRLQQSAGEQDRWLSPGTKLAQFSITPGRLSWKPVIAVPGRAAMTLYACDGSEETPTPDNPLLWNPVRVGGIGARDLKLV